MSITAKGRFNTGTLAHLLVKPSDSQFRAPSELDSEDLVLADEIESDPEIKRSRAKNADVNVAEVTEASDVQNIAGFGVPCLWKDHRVLVHARTQEFDIDLLVVA
ncbi:hypothetical protein C8Q74DRAFT_1216074 [Fomes fomentarius]|nr:hypothetical protein C8Q74DRAFT_1216074 [Fomes fomentarius]